MTTVWGILGALTVLVAATVGYVGWRDRRRVSSADDTAASRAAAAVTHRQAARGLAGHASDHSRFDSPQG